jgi:hypothetical protein
MEKRKQQIVLLDLRFKLPSTRASESEAARVAEQFLTIVEDAGLKTPLLFRRATTSRSADGRIMISQQFCLPAEDAERVEELSADGQLCSADFNAAVSRVDGVRHSSVLVVGLPYFTQPEDVEELLLAMPGVVSASNAFFASVRKGIYRSDAFTAEVRHSGRLARTVALTDSTGRVVSTARIDLQTPCMPAARREPKPSMVLPPTTRWAHAFQQQRPQQQQQQQQPPPEQPQQPQQQQKPEQPQQPQQQQKPEQPAQQQRPQQQHPKRQAAAAAAPWATPPAAAATEPASSSCLPVPPVASCSAPSVADIAAETATPMDVVKVAPKRPPGMDAPAGSKLQCVEPPPHGGASSSFASAAVGRHDVACRAASSSQQSQQHEAVLPDTASSAAARSVGDAAVPHVAGAPGRGRGRHR